MILQVRVLWKLQELYRCFRRSIENKQFNISRIFWRRWHIFFQSCCWLQAIRKIQYYPKLECVGHVQKRFGKRRNKVEECKGSSTPISGRGKINEKTINSMQNLWNSYLPEFKWQVWDKKSNQCYFIPVHRYYRCWISTSLLSTRKRQLV